MEGVDLPEGHEWPVVDVSGPLSKTVRGRYRGAVTLVLARLDIRLDEDEATQVSLEDLRTQLHKDFYCFEVYHTALHATLLDETAQEASEEYFNEVKEHYTATLEKVETRLTELSTRDVSEDVGEADRTQESNLEDRFNKHVHETNAQLATISKQLEALLGLGGDRAENVVSSTPLKETPTGEAGKRVSFGGISTVAVSESGGSPEETTLHDTTVAAMMSVADSCKRLAESNVKSEPTPKLPTFKILPFSGEAVDYWPFMKQFESQIEPYVKDAGVRLNYLVQNCCENLRQTLQSCSMRRSPEAAYERAKEILEKKFGKFEDVTQAWLEKFYSFPNVRTVPELFDLNLLMSNCFETLMALDLLPEFETKANLMIIVQKLPFTIRERWQQEAVKISKASSRRVRMHDLIDFCETVYEEKSDHTFGGALEAGLPERRTTVRTGQRFQRRPVYAQTDCPVSQRVMDAHPASGVYAGQAQTAAQHPPRTYGPIPPPGFRQQPRPYVPGCFLCGKEHVISRCDDFLARNPVDRFKTVSSLSLCLNCFHPRHVVSACTSANRCRICNQPHHTLLHRDEHSVGGAVRYGHMQDGEYHPAENVCTAVVRGKMALPVVSVKAVGRRGDVTVLALLDSGSTSTMCTDRLLDLLDVPSRPYNSSISTIHEDNVTMAGRLTEFDIVSTYNHKQYHLSRVFAKPTLNISSSCRALPIDVARWEHLSHVQVPDVEIDAIDLLIGQNCHQLLVHDERIEGRNSTDPHAILSPLGWYISGPMGDGLDDGICCATMQDDATLSRQVEKFWKIDDVSTCVGKKELSKNDKWVLDYWNKHTTHDGERYTVPIPFKNESPNLPNNRSQAVRKLYSLTKRLIKENTFDRYCVAIQAIEQKRHSEPVDVNEEVPPGWLFYLAHHCVFHPRKPDKPRVVHDAGAEFEGVSLNDVVHQGPDLLNKLIDVFLNFRLDEDAVAGDVEGMFNQILIFIPHRNVTRYLWWKDNIPGGEIVEYRMRTHLFGGVWSPSCANFVLQKTADDFGGDFEPEVVDMIKKRFYVDDGMRAVSPPDVGVKLLMQAKKLLKMGGFNFVKMVSSSESIMRALPPADLVAPVDEVFAEDAEPMYMLGNPWIPKRDVLVYKIVLPDKPNTKRGVLSCMASLYDPLGLVTPIVMAAKMIFQECCREGLDWDQSLEGTLLEKWVSWKLTVSSMESIEIRRCVLVAKVSLSMEGLSFEIHMFSDASTGGYGAVAYMLVRRLTEILGANLLMSKGKLSPLKRLNVPRLELTAAHMAVQIERYLVSTLDVIIDSTTFSTDSTIVLFQVMNQDKRYPTYEANRLGFITEHTVFEQWYYVPTDVNPADVLSRGCQPDDLKANQLWKSGPEYLLKERSCWPVASEVQLKVASCYVNETVLGVSEVVAVARALPKEIAPPLPTDYFLEYFSSWFRMKRALVYLVRFVIYLARKRAKQTPITSEEISKAEWSILRYVQQKVLVKGGEDKERRYRKLFPVEQDGLVRVGGRLSKAAIHPGARHPVVVPSGQVARAIIWDLHVDNAHAGAQRTLADLQQRYWIIRARRLIRHIVDRCFRCRKLKSPLITPLMADLPADRVLGDEPPFTNTGIDYFGPLVVKMNRKEYKRWGCLMTCFQTRAIHLEVAWSLDLDSCVNAIVRFASRRGFPKKIKSDNGTNLVGAKAEIKRAIDAWNGLKLSREFLKEGCDWSFNPPAASHMGGVWERHIRSVRSILMNLANSQSLTDETLSTFMCMSEDIVNSRPITPVGTDPEDLAALTPNDLLKLNTRVVLPIGLFDKSDALRRRWRQAQYLACLFWDRWKREYLPTLTERTKWYQQQKNLVIGDVVVIKSEMVPRNHWALGRIKETYPDSEGVVRAVDVFTGKGVLRRPVHKLCLLEAVVKDG